MAIGLKRDIIVITDSTTGSVFGWRFPKEIPPVKKMKGGVFEPLTLQDLYTNKNGNSLYVIYNDRNHYDSTIPVNHKIAV